MIIYMIFWSDENICRQHGAHLASLAKSGVPTAAHGINDSVWQHKRVILQCEEQFEFLSHPLGRKKTSVWIVWIFCKLTYRKSALRMHNVVFLIPPAKYVKAHLIDFYVPW